MYEIQQNHRPSSSNTSRAKINLLILYTRILDAYFIQYEKIPHKYYAKYKLLARTIFNEVYQNVTIPHTREIVQQMHHMTPQSATWYVLRLIRSSRRSVTHLISKTWDDLATRLFYTALAKLLIDKSIPYGKCTRAYG